MADAMPDYKVEQQRLRKNIAEQQAKIEEQKLNILEMADRKRKHEENIAAAQKAIDDYTKKLQGLQETHGALTDAEYKERAASIGKTD